MKQAEVYDEIRARHFPAALPAGVTVHAVDGATYKVAHTALFHHVFPDWTEGKYLQIPPERESAVEALRHSLGDIHREHFVFFSPAGANIGWSLGMIENPISFRMSNTGILPAWQRRGIYSGFLRVLLGYIQALGYERVTSYHHPNNRAVLIAKLKAGFNITGMELAEDVGAVVKMTYFCHEDRYRAFERGFLLEAQPPPGANE